MTHGIGSISTSGGGGFSSAGFNAAVFAGASTSGSRRRRHNDTTDGECCCFFCSLILFFTCVMKMKPMTRIILTWFYVILGAVLAIVLTLRHYNASVEVPISPSDMRILDQPSLTFCDRVKLDCSSLIDYYVMKNEPSIDESRLVNYTEKVQGDIERDKYEYWGFYLLKGSNIKMSYIISESIEFYVFKGDDGFNKWKQNVDCYNCYWKQRYLFNSGDVEYDITETDQYYFLFSNEDQFVFPSKHVDVTFHLSRTAYVLDHFDIRCRDQFDCNIGLNIGDRQVIVVRMPEFSSFDTPVTVYCQPRVYTYFLLYILSPCVVGICVTVAIFRTTRKKSCSQRERRESTVHIVSNDEHLSGFANESGPQGISNSTAGVIRPPSYSAAQKVLPPSTGAPPSYEQATKKEQV